MSAVPELLQSMFGAAGAEEFLNGYWPERVYAAHGEKSRLPAAFLDEDLNEFDALSLRYKGVVSFFGGDESSHMVPVDGIDAAAPYRSGLSVYLNDVGPYFPDMQKLVRELEELRKERETIRARVQQVLERVEKLDS